MLVANVGQWEYFEDIEKESMQDLLYLVSKLKSSFIISNLFIWLRR
jgi:hypothetical protein